MRFSQSYHVGIEIFQPRKCRCSASLLSIVPCWNWNPKWKRPKFARRRSLNRTMLELKLCIGDVVPGKTRLSIVPCWNWNMEFFFAHLYFINTLNRTMLELKCDAWKPSQKSESYSQSYHVGIEITKTHNTPPLLTTLSIVPCWNWNAMGGEADLKHYFSYILTHNPRPQYPP